NTENCRLTQNSKQESIKNYEMKNEEDYNNLVILFTGTLEQSDRARQSSKRILAGTVYDRETLELLLDYYQVEGDFYGQIIKKHKFEIRSNNMEVMLKRYRWDSTDI